MDLATRWSNLFVGMSPASFFNFSFLPKYGVYFLQALGYTLLLAVISVLLAVIPALLLAFMRLSKNKFVRGISGAYIAIFRSTPLLVQLSIITSAFLARSPSRACTSSALSTFPASSPALWPSRSTARPTLPRSSVRASLPSTRARLRPRARWVFPPRRR